MHEHPFTLVRARVLDADGDPVFKRDMWLITIGVLNAVKFVFVKFTCKRGFDVPDTKFNLNYFLDNSIHSK